MPIAKRGPMSEERANDIGCVIFPVRSEGQLRAMRAYYAVKRAGEAASAAVSEQQIMGHPHVLLHIPHASKHIPERWRKEFSIDDSDLADELLRITDHYTDELFVLEGAARLVHPVSRLLLDPERFLDADLEPMEAKGFGAVYRATTRGEQLRSDESDWGQLIKEFYTPHHAFLNAYSSVAAVKFGGCLIVDCHSFPSEPLAFELDQSTPRPDCCIGTAGLHTPGKLLDAAIEFFGACGYSVAVDRPYSGSIVPSNWRDDPRVSSIMIEVKRSLYMDEASGSKGPNFEVVKQQLSEGLHAMTGAWAT